MSFEGPRPPAKPNVESKQNELGQRNFIECNNNV